MPTKVKKLLVIAYYWPPAGGPGVHRWLRMVKYLATEGVQVHVVAPHPDDATYPMLDPNLEQHVPSSVVLHTTRSREILQLYARLFGKGKVPISSFANVKNDWKMKIMTILRSHLFIPDPRIGWRRFAYRKACEVIEAEGITHVVSTSPPHSVQLIGRMLKKKYRDRIRWVADFRDPWTTIHYYHKYGHTRLSAAIDSHYERQVVQAADGILTTHPAPAADFKKKVKHPSKVHIITNGYDHTDFENVTNASPHISPRDTFHITFTGSLAESYHAEVFFDVLARVIKADSSVSIQFNLVGEASPSIEDYAVRKIGNCYHRVGRIPQHEVPAVLCASDMLFLVTPPHSTSSKLYEYLVARRPIIAFPHNEGTATIEACGCGQGFAIDDTKGMQEFITRCVDHWRTSTPIIQPDEAVIAQYSRQRQALHFLSFLEGME